MLQKFPVHKCEWIKDTFQFHKDFIKDYNKESDEGYFHKVDVYILKNMLKSILIYHFYSKIEKFGKLVANFHDKIESVILKQALNKGLIFKKVHGVIKFNQKV